MRKRTVYRLEYADGKGPYIDIDGLGVSKSALEMLEELSDAHSNDMAFHPPIYLDIDSNVDKGMLCACPTEKALKRWFGVYFEPLLKIGFRVAVYETRDYIMGNSRRQLMFRP